MTIKELISAMRDAASKATPGKRTWVQFDGIHLLSESGGIILEVVNPVQKKDAVYIALSNPANITRLLDALQIAEDALEYISYGDVVSDYPKFAQRTLDEINGDEKGGAGE